jgi:two-component system, cell cycle sensor histidine kinase PleC
MTCAPKLAPPLEEDADVGARPAFLIDAAAGAILAANGAGWAAWGLDGSSASPPVNIDRAMPALARIGEIAGTGRVEHLTFWSARGLLRLACRVERSGTPDAGQYLVRAVGRRLEDSEIASQDGAGAGGLEVTPSARLAHEVRTPLSAVIAYAEILKDEHFGPLANARYREYARHIFDGARHALGVVEGILGNGGGAGGVPALAFAHLDAAAVVENCLAVARPLAEQAGLELVGELAPGLPRVVADELSLKQMLLNLITNAIKFARPGDRVTVRVAAAPKGGVQIQVADTGPGMGAAPVLPGLEERGATVSRPASEAHLAGHALRSERARNTGLGIGLPLTRALAEANGAVLQIDSAPGRGTCATIAFGADRIAAG